MSDFKKKYLSSPLVVSTECSTFKSFYLACRHCLCHSKSSLNLPDSSHHNPISLSPQTTPNCFIDGRAAAQAYWRRIRQLERELIKLEKWIDIEKNLRDCIDNSNVTHLVKLDKQRTRKNLVNTQLVRLVNGGYMYNIKKTCRPWGRLMMQASAPAIAPAETGSNASQVFHRMALMGKGRLRNWLLESMPMDDIWRNPMEEKERSPVSPGSEKGFMEAIVSSAMGKMETLVLKGLRIQMGENERVQKKKKVVSEKREERTGERIILAMLIQLRDPVKENEAVGEIMIGLVEASVADVEESGCHIEGVHVAGMSTCLKENKESFRPPLLCRSGEVNGEGNYMWSVSVRDCEGRCSCSCWECVRNPDIGFAV